MSGDELATCHSPITFRPSALPEVLLASVPVSGVKGKPLWTVRMPVSCQPEIKAVATLFPEWKR